MTMIDPSIDYLAEKWVPNTALSSWPPNGHVSLLTMHRPLSKAIPISPFPSPWKKLPKGL